MPDGPLLQMWHLLEHLLSHLLLGNNSKSHQAFSRAQWFWQRPKSEGLGSSRTGNAFCIQHHVLAVAGAHECLAVAMPIKYLRPFNCLLSVKKPHSNGRGGEPQDGLHPGSHLLNLFNSSYRHSFLFNCSTRHHSNRSPLQTSALFLSFLPPPVASSP
ncbi:MAG: hypothetical protein A4E49_00095 [Methanosaeta sp. PtaU1.Bin112]|nr:MAG: hypothetical protein A4E49_00095 [Methanosaeta sp. PtaU1.Bin112]